MSKKKKRHKKTENMHKLGDVNTLDKDGTYSMKKRIMLIHKGNEKNESVQRSGSGSRTSVSPFSFTP